MEVGKTEKNSANIFPPKSWEENRDREGPAQSSVWKSWESRATALGAGVLSALGSTAPSTTVGMYISCP